MISLTREGGAQVPGGRILAAVEEVPSEGSSKAGIRSVEEAFLEKGKGKRFGSKAASSGSYRVGVAVKFNDGVSGSYSRCPPVGGGRGETGPRS